MTGADGAARRALAAAARLLDERGLNQGSAGNLSVRIGAGLLVTPTGVPPERLRPRDVVALDADGSARPGQMAPTSEWRLHTEVMAARADVAAVVHTHSPEATALACVGQPLPAVHYVVARAGVAPVPCAPYATYGSRELAAHVVEALGRGGRACLMANHGLVAVGSSLDAAVALAVDLEWLAGVYRRALVLAGALGRAVTVVPADEIARVGERFASYGQPERPPP